MKRIRFKYTPILICIIFLWSCGEEKLDQNSIFPSEEIAMNRLDEWLYKNYMVPYNIDFKYRFDYKESNNEYNLVPADYDKSVALAKLIKHLWVDAYGELKGAGFLKEYSPRIFHLIGSPAYNSQGSLVLGTAEGGLKITLFNVNQINLDKISVPLLNNMYLSTMHHEFAHILHQTKNYPPEFNLISKSDYQSSSWVNLLYFQYIKMGFVSAYASSEAQEDFVEIIATYITKTETAWQTLISNAGEEGGAKLKAKFEIIKKYMETSWGVDIEALRSIVLRRSGEVPTLDLQTLD